MNSVKKSAQALRDECNRLADKAMLEATFEHDLLKKMELLDASQAYRAMADNHGETRLYAEMVRPEKFTKPKGATTATERRRAFLLDVAAKTEPTTYDALVADAVLAGAEKLWPNAGDLTTTVWNFARKHRLLA